uniref:Uncharacterized protein n=1 Tax=Rhizophora mucronata TaxID=61149 RepID=A0A2P2P9A7_RHIMU
MDLLFCRTYPFAIVVA